MTHSRPVVTIELAKPDDLRALPGIEKRAASRFAEWGISPQLLVFTTPPAELREARREGRLWIARVASGDVVGFALVELVGREPHLEEMDVEPQHGRQGIGRLLLEAVKHWARRSGHSRLTLTTYREIPWNAPFYARCGFRELAEQELTPELREIRRREGAAGLDPERRVAMVCVLPVS